MSGQAPHGEETPLLPMFTKPVESENASRLPSGLHVDTNGGCPRRFAAAILYLTTPTGGETVFPAAAQSKATSSSANLPLRCGQPPDEEILTSGRQLLEAGMLHTRAAKVLPEKNAADKLLGAAEAGW